MCDFCLCRVVFGFMCYLYVRVYIGTFSTDEQKGTILARRNENIRFFFLCKYNTSYTKIRKKKKKKMEIVTTFLHLVSTIWFSFNSLDSFHRALLNAVILILQMEFTICDCNRYTKYKLFIEEFFLFSGKRKSKL